MKGALVSGNMKGFVLWLLVLMVVFLSSVEGGYSVKSGVDFSHYGRHVATIARNRKLMEIYNLEDYHPIDPSPSSKASIRHGPIQHGTPLMPYIPRPSPPPTRSDIP